jgi:hypothetical protein
MEKEAIESRLEKPISRRYLDYILSRKRRPSPDLAKDLEQATGIDRRSWLWPDEFPNPYLVNRLESHHGRLENGGPRSTEHVLKDRVDA